MSERDQYRSLFRSFTKPGLTRTILIWFLILALVPLSAVCWVGYQQSSTALRDGAARSLREVTVQQSRFINNWFNYRFKDLQVQAENRQNSRFIQALAEGFRNSGQTANDYVGSYQWTSLVEANKADLVQLMQVYAYYDDLFLIDLNGNILFSIKQEADLGTNLLTGAYRDTHFASVVRQSLSSGRALFSDFERYGPSENIFAGFLSAPLIDEHGDKVGVFAMQLKVDSITELTSGVEMGHESQVSYLVGDDLLSRTAIHSTDDILRLKIETEQTKLWLSEQVGGAALKYGEIEKAFDYVGPFDNEVIGLHYALTIGDVEWSLISELDTAEALAPAQWMAKLTLFILLTMFCTVLLVALFISRRITQPLKALVTTVEKAALGGGDQQVAIISKDETGQLAKAFNFMIETRNAFERELKAGAAELQQSLVDLEEQRFALDQHAIVAITDPAGTITFVNEKFTAISGYSQNELLGQNHRLLNSGHHSRGFFRSMYEALEKGEVWREEICNRAKNGNLYWVDSTIMPLLDVNGKTKSFIAIRADITRRKMAELNNENSLAIVEATLEATDNGIVVLNEYGKALHHNQRFLDLLGLSKEQVLFGDIQSMLALVVAQLQDGESFQQVVEGIQKSGGLFSVGAINFLDDRIVEYSTRELSLPAGALGQVWSFNDITPQTRAAEELIRAKEEAEEATRSKSDFLANMSHEIRTPMNGVLGMLNLLSSSDLNTKQRHQVRLARSSGDALLTLINDILDFSKIEAGKLEMESIDFDLRQLLGELAESMALQAQSIGLELVLDLALIEQSQVKGDPTRIRQLFTNLVGNAMKFTADGEIVIRAALSAGEEGEMILSASVSDTGIGIPAAQIKYLFDSFSQVDASTTRKFGGTGLGLAIVKSLCELMGGEITVTSEPGEGSCFAFILRLGISEQSALVRPSVDLHGVRILIVDDNETNLEVLEQQLSLWGAYVSAADSGASALRILDEQAAEPFPVAIVDMQMPEMDGADLGKAIRADVRFQATQLIMMTSMSEVGDAQFFADLGFAAYFAKPTTTSDLFDALAVVLGGGEALLAAKPLVTHNYLRSFVEQKGGASTQPSLGKAKFRLLLVEDNVINQQVAMGMLEDMGYYPDIADNGVISIAMLQQAPIDAPYHLLLMDCQMPVLDGYEATAKIRRGDVGERYRGINIIAMTANVMAGDRARCLQAGMNDYIAKPIDPDLLESCLLRYLSQVEEPHPTGVDHEPIPTEGDNSELESKRVVWDREGLFKRVRAKEPLLRSLLKQFGNDMPAEIALLQQAVVAGELTSVASLAHTLKGIAGNLSGQHLQDHFATMEQAAISGDGAEVKRQWPGLLEQYQQLSASLKAYLQAREEETLEPDLHTQVPGIGEELDAIIRPLALKLEQGSYVGAGELQGLQVYCHQVPEKALLEKLREHLSQFDTLSAAACVVELGALLQNKKIIIQ